MRSAFVRMVLAVDAIGVAAFLAGLVALMFAGEHMLRAEED